MTGMVDERKTGFLTGFSQSLPKTSRILEQAHLKRRSV
jgi:hypothetical protein